MLSTCSGVGLGVTLAVSLLVAPGVTLGVELEASLLVGVVTIIGVPVLPPVVGVDVGT